MSKYLVLVEVDDETLRNVDREETDEELPDSPDDTIVVPEGLEEEIEAESIEYLVSRELGWAAQSGIHVETLTEIDKNALTFVGEVFNVLVRL